MKTTIRNVAALVIGALLLTACGREGQEAQDAAAVDRQQAQYAKGQPIPAFDWSLERHLVIALYQARNTRAATHSVWRSNTGMIEGDCPSMGYGIPYDTSLTNPQKGATHSPASSHYSSIVVGQAEPNGVFASTNTSATWVLCTGAGGIIEPVYVESKVSAFPYPLNVDYDNNRVTKAGESTVKIDTKRK